MSYSVAMEDKPSYFMISDVSYMRTEYERALYSMGVEWDVVNLADKMFLRVMINESSVFVPTGRGEITAPILPPAISQPNSVKYDDFYRLKGVNYLEIGYDKRGYHLEAVLGSKEYLHVAGVNARTIGASSSQ
jgi:hypothetical protein